jgi:hypothetical protein
MSEVIPVPMPAGTPPVPPGIPTSTVSTPPIFRGHFPEFGDTDTYPDTQVQFYLDVSSVSLPVYRWGSMLQVGVELMTAHMLALSQYAMLGGGAGGVPGMAKGLLTSKSVSRVSVGYDVNITGVEGGGPWNYTMYGQRFYWMMRIIGIGGYEVLGDSAVDNLSGLVLTWSRGVMMRWGS